MNKSYLSTQSFLNLLSGKLKLKEMPVPKHIVITTNIYRHSSKTKSDFDHPAGLNKLYENLHPKLAESISCQETPPHTKLTWHIIITGKTPRNTISINKLKSYANPDSQIILKIFTLKDIENIYQTDPELYSFSSYSGIRNISFALAFKDDADILIKIDADEELPKTYLKEVLSTFKNHPKIKALGGLYLEEGRRLSPLLDPLESWPKYSAMNVDATQLISGASTSESFFAKGGNMILKRAIFSNICHPTVTPRGEDFAFVLRSWLIYYNGNPKANFKKGNEKFKFFVNPSKKMSIIHHTQHAAIRNFLNYTEKNLIRFAYETNTILNQDGLSIKDLIARSTYIGKVIFLPNFPTVVNTIYEEMHKKTRKGTPKLTNPVTAALKASAHPQKSYPTYTKSQIQRSKARVLRVWKKIQNKNYFKHFQEEQARYIQSLKQIKDLPFTYQ